VTPVRLTRSTVYSRNPQPHVLRDIELEVATESSSHHGTSGSGKSTLLNILGILDDYDLRRLLARRYVDPRSDRAARALCNRFIASCSSRSICCRFRPAREVALRSTIKASRPKRNRSGAVSRAVGLRDWRSTPPRCRWPEAARRDRRGDRQARLILADEPTGASTQTSQQIMIAVRDPSDRDHRALVCTMPTSRAHAADIGCGRKV